MAMLQSHLKQPKMLKRTFGQNKKSVCALQRTYQNVKCYIQICAKALSGSWASLTSAICILKKVFFDAQMGTPVTSANWRRRPSFKGSHERMKPWKNWNETWKEKNCIKKIFLAKEHLTNMYNIHTQYGFRLIDGLKSVEELILQIPK